MITYKSIVLDIDGTLLNSQGEISEETKEAILRLQKEKNGIVVLASGRPHFGLNCWH
jgi:HAD superfamily hydrolase (TIGR01484 family)